MWHWDAFSLRLVLVMALTDSPWTQFFNDTSEWLALFTAGGGAWAWDADAPVTRAQMRRGVDAFLRSGVAPPLQVKAGAFGLVWVYTPHRAPHNLSPTWRGVLFALFRQVSPDTVLGRAPFDGKSQVLLHQLVSAAWTVPRARCVAVNQNTFTNSSPELHYALGHADLDLAASPPCDRVGLGSVHAQFHLGGLRPAAHLVEQSPGAWSDTVVQHDPYVVRLWNELYKLEAKPWRGPRNRTGLSQFSTSAAADPSVLQSLFGCSKRGVVQAAHVDGQGDQRIRALLHLLANALGAHAGFSLANTEGTANVQLATTRGFSSVGNIPPHMDDLGIGHVLCSWHICGPSYRIKLAALSTEALIRMGLCPTVWDARLTETCTQWNGPRGLGREIKAGDAYVLSREARWLCTHEVIVSESPTSTQLERRTLVTSWFWQADMVAPFGDTQCLSFMREKLGLSATTPYRTSPPPPRPPVHRCFTCGGGAEGTDAVCIGPPLVVQPRQPTPIPASSDVSQQRYTEEHAAVERAVVWQGLQFNGVVPHNGLGRNLEGSWLHLALVRLRDRNRPSAVGLQVTTAIEMAHHAGTWALRAFGHWAKSAPKQSCAPLPAVGQGGNKRATCFVLDSGLYLAQFVQHSAVNPALAIRMVNIGQIDVMQLVLVRDVQQGEFLTCCYPMQPLALHDTELVPWTEAQCTAAWDGIIKESPQQHKSDLEHAFVNFDARVPTTGSQAVIPPIGNCKRKRIVEVDRTVRVALVPSMGHSWPPNPQSPNPQRGWPQLIPFVIKGAVPVAFLDQVRSGQAEASALTRASSATVDPHADTGNDNDAEGTPRRSERCRQKYQAQDTDFNNARSWPGIYKQSEEWREHPGLATQQVASRDTAQGRWRVSVPFGDMRPPVYGPCNVHDGVIPPPLLRRLGLSEQSVMCREIQQFVDTMHKLSGRSDSHVRVTWHMYAVQPCAPPQEPHQDGDAIGSPMVTIMLPLTWDIKSGSTEFPVITSTEPEEWEWNDVRDMGVLLEDGDAWVFCGETMHRGGQHLGELPRYAIYIEITAGDGN